MITILLLFVPVILVSGEASVDAYSGKGMSVSHHGKPEADPKVCRLSAACEPIPNATCFGTPLPYVSTSVALAGGDLSSPLEAQESLALWQGLRGVPRCWAVVQPLLCAVYLPKCENGSVWLPSQEMCRITRGPCRSVEVDHQWPEFLRCENRKLFPSRCRNPLQEVKFNTSSRCVAPLLVETDNPDNWYQEVEGCGLRCQDPFFTQQEHDTVHKFIGFMASICLTTNVFTVVTFFIGWKTANRYPAIIIFFINVCLSGACLGWLIQFFPGAREEIVCMHDGTIRRRQPRSGEHLCSITFILVYSFVMAAVVWFVILAYAWHVLFRHASPHEALRKRVAYFHLAAWCVPLVLTTITMATKEVDGDAMSGVCFVGHSGRTARSAYVLLPVGLAALVGGFFLASGLYTLIKVKLKSEEVTNVRVKKRIHHMIFKIGVFSAFALVFVMCTFACHAYQFVHQKEWDDSLREYIVCLATRQPRCALKSRPGVALVQLNIFSLFGFGIIMSSWVWTRENLESWKRFFFRLCAPAERKALNMKRQGVIRKAYAHRPDIQRGHLSFSLDSTHEDPVAMNLEVASVASQDISSSWAAALPRFLARRNAVTSLAGFAPRHHSSVSDVSRHLSLDSFNQPNPDSLSLEQEYMAQALRHQRRKTRKERERFVRANRIAPWFPRSRRSSDTSLQSGGGGAPVDRVTRATSTGDLERAASTVPPPPRRPLLPPPHRALQKPSVAPPFTHGMSDRPAPPLVLPQAYVVVPAPGLYLPYAAAFAPLGPFSPLEPPLLPLHPRVDSASEAEYLPIVLSDSEFTDAGLRSLDEGFRRPGLEPQACAKTQFLQRMHEARAPSPPCRPGRESAVPPPSPAGSSSSGGEEATTKEEEGALRRLWRRAASALHLGGGGRPRSQQCRYRSLGDLSRVTPGRRD